MHPVLRRVTAIIALVFMLIFTGLLTWFLYDFGGLGGNLPIPIAFFGFFGILLHVILRLSDRQSIDQNDQADDDEKH